MALVTLYLFYPPLNAQISQGGLPYSFTHTVGDSIPTITLPFMNVNSLIQAEEIDTTIRSYKYGFVNDININVNEYGDWENQPDSSRIWRIKIISPSAVSINLTFNQFFLPEGCELFIYTEDQNTILGAFTTLNNSDTNTFATSMLIGNTSIVELFEPFTNWGQTQLEISRVISGFREFNRDCGSSYQCQENINCGMGLEWYDQKRSVVMYTIPNGGTCTGTLINNVYNENLQFLITANHCLSSYDPNYGWSIMENIDQIVIYFNYESPDCDSIDCSELDFQTTTGAMVRAISPIENGTAIADFMMLEINGVIPEYYNVYYSGFSLELDPINSASIHHPAGDIKKISVDYDSPEQMYLEPIGSFSGSFWGAYWDYGSFQMGSSGAPLFDQEKRLIGTATGTSDNCINDGLTSFGQFYEAYWHGDDLNIDSNNITDNVRAWLNHFSPNETVNYIDGREGTEYVNFGCTDSTAYNYDPEATADNGSCYGERGDINLDECVNILDMIWLTDIILGNYTPTEYETWAANVDELGYINVDDQIFLVGIILNNPLCSGGSARLLSNSYINFQGESSLTRNEDYLTEIVLSTESDIRASHFEFGLPPVEIINVYMADEFSDMTINWTVREDTLAILFYGAGGEVIPAGTHTVAMIESNIPLSRLGGQDIQYLNGVYANGDQDLISLQWGTGYFDDTVIPAEFSLHQPYPNPFNPVTKISYDLQVGSFTNISVYDLNGGLVDVLVSGFNEAGSHTIEWNAKNKSSGVYILQLNSGSFSATRKLLLLK